MDIATIFGFVAGIGLMLWAVMSKSDLGAFVDGASVAIVLGGAVAAALISFPLGNLLGVAKVVKNAFFAKASNASALIADLVSYAEVARRDGILSLENVVADVKDPFIVSGIQMAVDGTDPDLIEAVMLNDLEAVEMRHSEGKALFDNIGRFAPAFGMIGTLIGLVIMLKNMDDPSSIGPAMAVALLTTFYGAVLANMVFSPLASKLERNSLEETLLHNIYMVGASSIGRQENPRRLEMLLNTLLPPAKRVQYFN